MCRIRPRRLHQDLEESHERYRLVAQGGQLGKHHAKQSEPLEQPQRA